MKYVSYFVMILCGGSMGSQNEYTVALEGYVRTLVTHK